MIKQMIFYSHLVTTNKQADMINENLFKEFWHWTRDELFQKYNWNN